MTKNIEKAGLYWKTDPDWYHIDPETRWPVINENAPEKAKQSFRQWERQWGKEENDDCISK